MGKFGVLFVTALASASGGAIGGILAASFVPEKHRFGQVAVGIIGSALGASVFGAVAAALVSDGVFGTAPGGNAAAMGPDLGMGRGAASASEATAAGHIASTLGPRGRSEDGEA